MMPGIVTKHFYLHVYRLAVVLLVAMASGVTGTFANAQSDDIVTAAKRGDLSAVKELLKSGADVNDRKNAPFGSTTALIEASSNGHAQVVQALLAAKADVDATRAEKQDGETALTLASQNNHVEVVQALLAAKADVNHPCCSANALYEAARAGNLDMVKVLLAAKPDLNLRSKISGNTALMWGISEGRLDIARLLMEGGANANLSNNKGVTPLTLAVQGSSPESLAMVRALLAAGVYVDSQNCAAFDVEASSGTTSYQRASGATALGVASSIGNTAAVQALLAAKADVNLRQCDGETPLTIASANGRADIVRLLLGAKADVNAKQSDGRTALTLALQGNHLDVATLLTGAGIAPPEK